MTRFSSALSPIVLAVALTAGCGSSSGRQVQTVTLSPASATAQNFPNGVVPFVATATFSLPPSPAPLSSQQLVWCVGNASGICDPDMPTYPSINTSGVAQCGPFVGTVTIVAGVPLPGISDAPRFSAFSTAQLTCP